MLLYFIKEKISKILREDNRNKHEKIITCNRLSLRQYLSFTGNEKKEEKKERKKEGKKIFLFSIITNKQWNKKIKNKKNKIKSIKDNE